MKPFTGQHPTAIASYAPRAPCHRLVAALLALALGIVPGSLYAESCSVNTSGVSFGTYDVFSPAANDATGNITVACTGGLAIAILVSYTILLSTGGGSYASRSMASGTHNLAYNLYLNSNRSIVWGDGTSGTGVVSDSYLLGIGTVQRDYPVYGRIPVGQNAYVGTYSDMIIVTVNY